EVQVALFRRLPRSEQRQVCRCSGIDECLLETATKAMIASIRKTGGRHVDEKPCHIPSPLLAELHPPLACERRAWFVLRLAGEFRSCRPLAANLAKQKRGPNSSLALASPATYRHGTTPYQKSPVRL